MVSAAYGKTLGEILDDAQAKADTRTIMAEAVSLATNSGVSPPKDIVETSLLKAQNFPYEAKTSFQRDYERPDKSDERDLFAGAMLRIANELRIELPKTKEIAAILAERKPPFPILSS